MSRYEHGRVLAVNEETLGSELVADHAAGVTSLTVEDAADFDEDGGWLKVGDQVVQYTDVDDDTGTITLAATLEAAGEEGDRVWLWDEMRLVVTTDKVAHVELDGDDDDADSLEATIPLHLLDDLPEGIRGGVTGESVLLEQDGDEWRIVDVLGVADSGAHGTQFWQDTHTVAEVGDQHIALTHEPLPHSEHLYWNGLYQPGTEWVRSGQAMTVGDGAGRLRLGDELTVEYAYMVGVATGTTINVPYGSTGWKYLVVPTSDSTNRSAVGYDDSGWATAPAPFGNANNETTWQNSTAANVYGWPHWVTPWTLATAIWVRRTIPDVVGGVVVQVRVDNQADVYWNGTFIGNSGELRESVEMVVPPELLTDSNVLAVRAWDLGTVDYLDVRVQSEG